MSNKRYYIPENFQNPYFNKDQIKHWNAYIKQKYYVWLMFERITNIDRSVNKKRHSARGTIWMIRMKKKWQIKNAVSRYMAFMYNTKYRTETFKLKK